MKPFMLFILASGMIFAGSVGRAAEKDDLKLLQGSWVVVGMESNGKSFPEDKVQDLGMMVTIKDRTLTTTRGGKSDTANFVIRSSTKPREIDTTELQGEKKDQTTLGVYAVDTEDNFKLCMRSGAKGRPTGFNTRKKSGDTTLIMKRMATEAAAK